MAEEYVLNHPDHGRVRVLLPARPPDEKAERAQIDAKIDAGEFQAIDSPIRGGDLPSAYSAVADMATRGVAAMANYGPVELGQLGLSKLTGGAVPAPVVTPEEQASGQAIGRVVVPQNLTELGIAAATAGAGSIASKFGYAGWKALAARGALTAAGGGAGGAVEGGVPEAVQGAVLGGAATVVGEAANKGLTVLKRLVKGGSPAVKEHIQKIDAKFVGDSLPDIPELRRIVITTQGPARGEPLLTGYGTPDDLRNLVQGAVETAGGKFKPKIMQILGAEQDRLLGYIEQNLQRPGMRAVFADPLNPKKHIPFDQARARLSEMREYAYAGKQADPATATILGNDAKKAYGLAQKQLETEIRRISNPLADLWLKSQEQFRVGTAVKDALLAATVGRGPKRGLGFDVDGAKVRLADKEASWRTRLGSENYDRLARAFSRGTDTPIYRLDDLQSPLGQVLDNIPGRGVGDLLAGPRRLAGTPFAISAGTAGAVRGASARGVPLAAGDVLDPNAE